MHPLARWLSLQGVHIDPGIHLVAREDGSTAVDALERIPAQATLARIPVSLVLSHRSSSLTRVLEGRHDPLATHPPPLRLAVHVAHELAQRPRSRWATYLEHCPRAAVPIALLWEGEAKRWTRGTELEKECRRIGVDQLVLRRFYDTVALPLFSSLPSTSSSPVPPPSFRTFQHAYTLVSSRAFQVSSFHPLALVPLADAFNHSDPPHVHLASDAWVCPECGRLDACPHDDEAASETSVSRETREEETVDMVSEREIDPGEEVFNTYGSGLSNAHLVAAYGFLLEGNEHDVVSFERRAALEVLLRSQSVNAPLLGEAAQLDLLECELDALSTAWWAAPSDRALVDVDHPLLAPLPPPALAPPTASASCIDADARVSPELWLAFALVAWQSARRGAPAREEAPRPAKRPRSSPSALSPAPVSVTDVVRLSELAAAAWRASEDSVQDALSFEPEDAGEGAVASSVRGPDRRVEREALRTAGVLVRRLCAARMDEQVEEARGMDVTALYERAEETEDPSLRLAIEFLAGERLLLDRVSSQWTFP